MPGDQSGVPKLYRRSHRLQWKCPGSPINAGPDEVGHVAADAPAVVRHGPEGIVASLGSGETRPELASCDLALDLPLGNKLPMCRDLGGRGGLQDQSTRPAFALL